jgi:cell wall-associated NlpC family hydrolase
MKFLLAPWLALILFAIAVTTGCSLRAPLPGHREYITPIPAAAAPLTSPPSSTGAIQSPSASGDSVPTSAKTASVWRQAAAPWLGTPYRMGGASREGIDCSGFSQALHQDVVQRRLPRTSQDQWSRSVAVSPNQVRPGDLVFFNTTGKGVSHVGVFLEGQEFVHASTSNGVIYSQLTDPYWSTRYLGARRPR